MSFLTQGYRFRGEGLDRLTEVTPSKVLPIERRVKK